MDDALKPIKSQEWNEWFTVPIPMLRNQTPVEASRTPEGRVMIDRLLAFYDSMNDRQQGGGFSINIPSRYAKWKLGYGPGSAEEFAEEESILYYSSPKRQTERKQRHTTKLEKKKASIFIPCRCEVIGCDKRGDDVRACSKCKCAYYCSKEHQVQDWPRHKLDCKAIAKLDFELQPKRFESSVELDKYPLGCFPLADAERGKKCFICHANPSEVDITYTRCCNLPVCNNSHEYKLHSYSRDFCQRSHMMYTSCDRHVEEEHEGDWRECEKCNGLEHGARPFASTNRFCVTPCLEKFLPQGSMLTYPCDTDGCASRFLPGYSTVTFQEDKAVCSQCTL